MMHYDDGDDDDNDDDDDDDDDDDGDDDDDEDDEDDDDDDDNDNDDEDDDDDDYDDDDDDDDDDVRIKLTHFSNRFNSSNYFVILVYFLQHWILPPVTFRTPEVSAQVLIFKRKLCPTQCLPRKYFTEATNFYSDHFFLKSLFIYLLVMLRFIIQITLKNRSITLLKVQWPEPNACARLNQPWSMCRVIHCTLKGCFYQGLARDIFSKEYN